MYSLVKANGIRAALEREFLPFAVALIIAQIWFKFGSFALELVGFLAVWFALGFLTNRILDAVKR